MANDWTRFARRIFINAPQDRIYNSWALSSELETWFLRKAEFKDDNGTIRQSAIQEGDTYLWEWHNWDGQELGKVTSANGKDALSFTFADGTVDIYVEPHSDGRCLLSLVQYGIGTDDKDKMNIHVGCSNGWTFWMTNLKAYLEHNILLHNTVEGSTAGYTGFEMINI